MTSLLQKRLRILAGFLGAGAAVAMAVWAAMPSGGSAVAQFGITAMSAAGLLGAFFVANRSPWADAVRKRFTVNVLVMTIIGLLVVSADKWQAWGAAIMMSAMFVGAVLALLTPDGNSSASAES